MKHPARYVYKPYGSGLDHRSKNYCRAYGTPVFVQPKYKPSWTSREPGPLFITVATALTVFVMFFVWTLSW